MRKLIGCLGILLLFTVAGIKAQECPADKVCLTRERAEKAFVDAETVKAQAIQITTLQEAINGTPATTTTPYVKGYKDLITDLRVDFARVSGEYTGFKMGAVRVDVAFDTAIKNTKKSCKPFSVCLF